MIEGDSNISVVIPIYNSVECIAELVRRLNEALAASGRSYEIVLVDDGSPDRSWETIAEIGRRDSRVRGIKLRRNFGQDNALMAGLNSASGEVVVIMDDDLQHDPADIEKLAAQVEAGYDVCFARFRAHRQAWWKRLGSWFNDRVANVILKKPKHIYLSPFKAIAGDVVREIVRYDGPYPYVDGLLFRVTQNMTQVEVEHHERHAGESNYNLARSIGVWLKLATSFSLAPLRIATYLGFGFSIIGFCLALYFVVNKLLGRGAPLGWASLIVTMLVMGGVQLVCLGLIGEHLGRAFLHLNKRPQYVVRETVNVDNSR